jgi:hypothetical protein
LVNVDRGPLALSNWNRIQAKIKGIRSTFDHLFSDVINDDATKTLIIPIVNALHFFVLVVKFNFECSELFLRFKYYDLDNVGPVIEAYEKKSGNRLSIEHSLIGDFCLYFCKEHVNCTFQIHIGRHRLDGAYVVKRNITYHTVER